MSVLRRWLVAVVAVFETVPRIVAEIPLPPGYTVVLDSAPPSGASFTSRRAPLARLPKEQRDAEETRVEVHRLLPNVAQSGPAEACNVGGEQASKEECLQIPGRGCMWIRMQSSDPALGQQASSVCLPCVIDGTDIPCWSLGAWAGSKQVTDCVMSCAHQKRVYQPGYSCSEGNAASQSQCFERGKLSGSNCMFLSYEDADGQSRAVCSPCSLPGTGTWTCPGIGETGPEDGTKVIACASQCNDELGDYPTVVPPALAMPSPGLVSVDSPANVMINAPSNIAVVQPVSTVSPAAAAMAAAQATAPLTPQPNYYFPVLLYPAPEEVFATTIAPMPASLPLWPSAWHPRVWSPASPRTLPATSDEGGLLSTALLQGGGGANALEHRGPSPRQRRLRFLAKSPHMSGGPW